MKKIVTGIMGICVAGMILCACEGTAQEQSQPVKEETVAKAAADEGDKKADESAEAQETATEPEESEEDSAEAVQVFKSDRTKEYYDGESGDYFEREYRLELRDDNTADYYEVTIYNGDNDVTSHMNGTITPTDSGYEFCYVSGDMWEKRDLVIVDDKITDVEILYSNSDTSEIAGTYTCASEEYGDITLEVSDQGSVTVKSDAIDLRGDIYLCMDKWEITANNYEVPDITPEEEVYIDWFVEFNGSEFTYITYVEATYGEYAGTIKAFGDLGEIEFTLTKEGKASADIEINGAVRHMEGNFYTDEGAVSGIYMSDYDGYGVDFSMGEVNGQPNYYGTYTVPLGAG